MAAELTAFRRDLHAHPELAGAEHRTTGAVADRLTAAGVAVTKLPGTGLLADLGAEHAAYRVALRADLDALPVTERTGLPWASTADGVSHACGHDLHTTALLGAGLALHQQHRELTRRGLAVRLVFQPAEEVIPGGAHTAIESGALFGVDRIFALHADPTIDAGKVGLREGAITSAADSVLVTLTGQGGHTSRPHLTQDLVFALAKVATEVPGVLSRRLDPRAGAALVWGSIHAGSARNVIPGTGVLGGTLRVLDADAWAQMEGVVEQVVQAVAAPYAVTAHVDHVRGVPPVVNRHDCLEVLRLATEAVLGHDADVGTQQSLGGEDYAWYLREVPGALLRLGTRTPGGPTYDLHQGDLVVDEEAVGIGAGLLAATAVLASGVPTAVGSGR
ncbi:MAG TPA: amidohydrolase [Dermatophilaceae bacterium]|nr:amidohydrolase [Dermatophilaceae bacterium]